MGKIREAITKYQKYGACLYEHSLASVWRHSYKGFFMMSAFKGTFSEEENLKRHEHLKSLLRNSGLGYFEVDGVYKYEDGHTESELSVFVPLNPSMSFDEFKKIAVNLGKEFNQESVLVKYPDEGGKGKATLAFSDGREIEIGEKVGYDKIADAYSRLRKGSHKGRTFILEGVRVPSNHINAYQLKAEGILF
jgi:hypothetical protein